MALLKGISQTVLGVLAALLVLGTFVLAANLYFDDGKDIIDGVGYVAAPNLTGQVFTAVIDTIQTLPDAPPAGFGLYAGSSGGTFLVRDTLCLDGVRPCTSLNWRQLPDTVSWVRLAGYLLVAPPNRRWPVRRHFSWNMMLHRGEGVVTQSMMGRILDQSGTSVQLQVVENCTE